MAQKILIRASRGRIVVYNLDKNVFKEAGMLVDCGDRIYIIKEEIIS